VRGRHSDGRSQQPVELTTSEAVALIDNISRFRPLLILTGGEPLLRRDLDLLIKHAAGLNLRTALATNGLLIDEKKARSLKEDGISVVSVSVDSADAKAHDSVRGVTGAHDAALKAVKAMAKVGISVQINTTVTNANVRTLPALNDLVRASGAEAWHVFFLVPTGRGNVSDVVSAREYYEALNWLEELENAQNDISVRPSCAPQYRLHEGRRGCLAGVSYAFVSYDGTVQPCGYLPLDAGSIRQQGFADIWQNSRALKRLRSTLQWSGACAACVYAETCRGCRARAFAMSGDCLGDDPYCGGMSSRVH
jgi:radical SAM protein with 4Fe4S-binding SPASM domain